MKWLVGPERRKWVGPLLVCLFGLFVGLLEGHLALFLVVAIVAYATGFVDLWVTRR